MGVATKHLLDKIDRIRARGDQRRADRITDARFSNALLYEPATSCRIFTSEEVAFTKAQFKEQSKKEKRKQIVTLILTIIMTPVCFYFGYFFLKMFNF